MTEFQTSPRYEVILMPLINSVGSVGLNANSNVALLHSDTAVLLKCVMAGNIVPSEGLHSLNSLQHFLPSNEI